MFNTITEDTHNPMIVYTRDELSKLRAISSKMVRSRFRDLDPNINVVYRPGSILEDQRLQPDTNTETDLGEHYD